MSRKESAAKGATIRLNGERVALTVSVVADLVTALGDGNGATGIAVAVNGEVIPRHRWTTHPVRPGDDVEIVTATQGG